MRAAQTIVDDLFRHYMHSPSDMPGDWSAGVLGAEERVRARRVGDFIAGMTDRYALTEHTRHFDITPELF